jgi:predicted ABC-type ATPase
MPDGLEKLKCAQAETNKQIREMISKGLSFTWETVFSHENRLEIMRYAKNCGYRVHLTYITTKHPNINVARVRNRVLEGGHDVPEEKIRSRYERSISFLPEMIMAADEVLIYDNSYEKTDPTLLFQKITDSKENSEPSLILWDVEDEDIKFWTMKNIVQPLNEMGVSIYCYKI